MDVALLPTQGAGHSFQRPPEIFWLRAIGAGEQAADLAQGERNSGQAVFGASTANEGIK